MTENSGEGKDAVGTEVRERYMAYNSWKKKMKF
jgi:hypothetical protein